MTKKMKEAKYIYLNRIITSIKGFGGQLHLQLTIDLILYF